MGSGGGGCGGGCGCGTGLTAAGRAIGRGPVAAGPAAGAAALRGALAGGGAVGGDTAGGAAGAGAGGGGTASIAGGGACWEAPAAAGSQGEHSGGTAATYAVDSCCVYRLCMDAAPMGVMRGRPRSWSHWLAAVIITSGATAAAWNTIAVTSTATKARATVGDRPMSTSSCTAVAVASDNDDTSERDGETAPPRLLARREPSEHPAPVLGESRDGLGGWVGGLAADDRAAAAAWERATMVASPRLRAPACGLAAIEAGAASK